MECFSLAFILLKLVVVLLVSGLVAPPEALHHLLPGVVSGVHLHLKGPGLGELEVLRRNLLGEDANDEAESTENPGDDVHGDGELAGAKEGGLDSEALGAAVDHPLLEEELEDQDSDEGQVVVDRLEHVELAHGDDAAIDRVEQVHKHENMEDERVEDQAVGAVHAVAERRGDQVWAVFLEEHKAAEEHEDGEHEALPGSLDKHLLPHERPHHRV